MMGDPDLVGTDQVTSLSTTFSDQVMGLNHYCIIFRNFQNNITLS